MTTAEQAQLTKTLTATAELYGRKLSRAAKALYSQALADLPLQDVVNALERAIRTSGTLPTVADLRNTVTGGGRTQAARALTRAVAEARRKGYLGDPKLDDRTMTAIVTVFGTWSGFCAAELTGAYGSRWQDAYEAAGRRVLDDARSLAGISPCLPVPGHPNILLPAGTPDARRLAKDAAADTALAQPTRPRNRPKGRTGRLKTPARERQDQLTQDEALSKLRAQAAELGVAADGGPGSPHAPRS